MFSIKPMFNNLDSIFQRMQICSIMGIPRQYRKKLSSILKAIAPAIMTVAVFSTSVFGQSQDPNADNFAKMVDFLPPAPNATAIVKYGGLSINKNNGAPSINIPITSISSRKIGTSVSLGYSSTGIKVDEIASRVGMGWALLAGGVITRTVRGTPDENNTRLLPPPSLNYGWTLYDYMRKVAMPTIYGGGYDSEPDLFNFNFNGYSGSFVFDENMKITPIEPNRFKYYVNFSGTGWTFKIITTDGVTYYFGGSSATEKTKQDQLCGKSFNAYIPTAWYLTKIEHPNGDAILFSYTSLEYTYDLGVNQTMYWSNGQPPYGGTLGDCASSVCSSPADVNCVTISRTQGVLLDKITVPGKQELAFVYKTRSDCNDRLVSKITLTDLSTQTGTSTAKVWNLIYSEVQGAGYTGNTTSGMGVQYTPYLVNLIERSSDSTLLLKHAFLYNDPTSRPPRLSYAQDHWGYFNGRNNASLIPPIDYSNTIIPDGYFTLATANRDPVTAYAVKGTLAKVIYPTGGMDSIVYESNQVYKTVSAGPSYHWTSTVTGSGLHTEVDKADTFSIQAGNSQTLKVEMTCSQNGSGTPDPVHNLGGVSIVGPGGVAYHKLLHPGEHFIEYVSAPSAGTFTVTINANGTIVTTNANVYFVPYKTSISSNVLVGGLRVKAVLTAPDGQAKPILKQYFYGNINTPDQSSLQPPADPIYKKIYQTRQLCSTGLTEFHHLFCDHTALYSNSLNALYDFQSSQPSYQYVTEVTGSDIYANGAIQTEFYASFDPAPQVAWGSQMMNATRGNGMSLMNGKIKEETVYKPFAKILKPIKQTTYTYILDPTVNKYVSGYTLNQKFYNDIMPNGYCDSSEGTCAFTLHEALDAYDMSHYDVVCRWVYVDSVKEKLYDENGNNPISTITKNYYTDTSNLMVTRTDRYNSKGDLEKTVYSYPKNFAGTAVYDSMLARNIISPVVDVKKYINSSLMEEVKTNYAYWGNANFLPASVQRAFLNNPLQNQGQLSKYDATGNLLEYKGADGIPVSIIYGYHNTYPVAKIAGAGYNAAIAQLTSDTAALQSLDGTALSTALNTIRTNLTTAQVATFTYRNLTGVISTTDIRNRASYYNYDGLQRLVSIQDFNNYYLKKIAYSFAQPNTSIPVNIFLNAATSQAFYCNCNTGYITIPTYYAVPKGKYMSTNSQAEADALAAAEIAANGQARADSYGICSQACDVCSGLDKKCINGVCEQGNKFLLSSVQQTSTTWLCTFYYKFSDGSHSSNFTETSNDPGCGWL